MINKLLWTERKISCVEILELTKLLSIKGKCNEYLFGDNSFFWKKVYHKKLFKQPIQKYAAHTKSKVFLYCLLLLIHVYSL